MLQRYSRIFSFLIIHVHVLQNTVRYACHLVVFVIERMKTRNLKWRCVSSTQSVLKQSECILKGISHLMARTNASIA